MFSRGLRSLRQVTSSSRLSLAMVAFCVKRGRIDGWRDGGGRGGGREREK